MTVLPSHDGGSTLGKAWLRFTGKDQWPATTATVYSCDFNTRRQNDSFGHYYVAVSYRVDGEIYTGEFADFGSERDESFQKDDTLHVRYNPKRPSNFYYPDLRTRSLARIIWFAVGIALALIVQLIVVLCRRF